MEDWLGVWYWAEYSHFSVGPESGQYKLSVTGFNSSSTVDDCLYVHHDKLFSSIDRDNDERTSSSCAEERGGGGFWYEYCTFANPSGAYLLGGLESYTGVA